MGVGLILSCVSVFLRDMMYIYGIILTIWNYLTPTFYSLEILPVYLQEIFKTNPATAERRKYNELISELTPILTKIKSASSLNKNNFSRNTREINNGLRMVSHSISLDSLRYENARKGRNPRFTQDYIQQLQQGTANDTHLPKVNEVSDIINELNNIKQEDVDKVMNLD